MKNAPANSQEDGQQNGVIIRKRIYAASPCMPHVASCHLPVASYQQLDFISVQSLALIAQNNG